MSPRLMSENKLAIPLSKTPHETFCILFVGRKVWRYSGNKLDKGFPNQMEKTDLPYKPSAAYVQKNQYADYQWYMFAVSTLEFI